MTTFNSAVAASSDDAMENGSTGAINRTAGQNYLDATYSHNGLRFLNVTIPQGATINSASLDLEVTSTTYDDPDLNIHAQAADDPATFSTTATDISSRSRTTAKTQWTATGIGSGAKSSPDLKSVIQEIIDRPGWVSGNSLIAILVNRGSANFRYYAYENASSKPPPELTIDYTAATGATPRLATVRLTTKIGGILTS